MSLNHIQTRLSVPDSAYLHRPVSHAPGTMEEQMMIAATAIYLGRRRGTSAKSELRDARRMILDHARQEPSDGR